MKSTNSTVKVSELVPTLVIEVDASAPDAASIGRAAKLLRDGALVAFPTETVYGLGACAVSDASTRRIFDAKGRPATSPLIVHVASIDQALRYVADMPPIARALADAFWPGPLSLVLRRSELVPHAVCAGGSTVAVRAPGHRVAIALADALDDGIAAPSANRSSRLPPMRAWHVLKDLDGRIDCVVDAGMCPGGLESTLIDLTSERAVVLRRGAVRVDDIARVVHVEVREPHASARVTDADAWIAVADRQSITDAMLRAEGKTAAIVFRSIECAGRVEVMPEEPLAYAVRLYDVLHALEDAGCDRVMVEAVPKGQGWEAITDRLDRLSGMARR